MTAPELPPELPPRPRTVEVARMYWDNLRHIGEPGRPSMLDIGPREEAHAEMARTAALVSIAESLDRLADPHRLTVGNRRTMQTVNALTTLEKELTKIRYILKEAMK